LGEAVDVNGEIEGTRQRGCPRKRGWIVSVSMMIRIFLRHSVESTPPGRLRSANRTCLTVPRCRFSTYGCRAFDYAGPTVWNSLPGELRNCDSFDRFKRFM